MPAIIQNTPVFTPFSFEQYIAPLNAYKQEYDAVEKQYNEVEAAASALEALAASAPNSQAYRTYRDYIDGLRVEADALAYNGLTPGSRQRLRNLRTGYTSNIVPILAGVQKWEKEKERWNNLKSYERLNTGDPHKQSPDNYIGKNPSSRIIDLNDLYTKGAQQGAAHSARQSTLFNTQEGRQILQEEYWYLSKLEGFLNGTQELNETIQNAADLMTALQQDARMAGIHVTNEGSEGLYHLLQSIGLDDMNSKIKKEALASTLSGYISGLTGKASEQFLASRSNANNNGSTTLAGGIVSDWKGSAVQITDDVKGQIESDRNLLNEYKKYLTNPNYTTYNQSTDPEYINYERQVSEWSINSQDYDKLLNDFVNNRKQEIREQINSSMTNLLQKYGLQDVPQDVALQRLEEILNEELTYSAVLYPYRTLNNAQNDFVVRNLNSHLNASNVFPGGTKTADSKSNTNLMFSYKKDNKQKIVGVSAEDYHAMVTNPATTINFATNNKNENDPAFGAIILECIGKPDIYIKPEALHSLVVTSEIVQEVMANLPPSIRNMLPQAMGTTPNNIPFATKHFDEYIKDTYRIYNAYEQLWIKNLSKTEKEDGQLIHPSVLLGTMLDVAFVALKISSDTQYADPSKTSSKLNI